MKLDEEIKNAICNNDVNYFKENLNVKFDINHKFIEDDNDTLLHYALSDKGSNTYLFLLEMNPNFSVLNNEGESLLHSIVYSGDSERIMLLSQKTKIDLDEKSNDGTTALLLAATLEKTDVFYYLISIGANVNLADNSGISPLHIVSQADNVDMVKMLVNNNANVFDKTKQGNLPLAFAVNRGNKEIIKCLYNAMGYNR